jgi:hypothetical protein
VQAKKKPPHGQAHLVFANAKANAQKTKRASPFPTATQTKFLHFYHSFMRCSKKTAYFYLLINI